MMPIEHFVGVNGDNRLDVIRLWNIEIAKIEATRVDGEQARDKEG